MRYLWIDDAAQPAIYLNAAQLPPARASYVFVADGDPLAVAPAVRHALASLDPALPLDAMQSYAEYIREALIGLTNAALLGVDAAIALLLAGIGMFGVMANLVGNAAARSACA